MKTYEITNIIIPIFCQTLYVPPYDTYIYIYASSYTGIILGMESANESRCYIVTSAPIAWAHTRDGP